MDQEIQTKECSKCHQIKQINDFYVDKKRKDGLYVYCKLCHNQNTNNWLSNNKEKKKNIDIQYRLNNPDKIKNSTDTYRKEHREKCRENTKRWRARTHDNRNKQLKQRRKLDINFKILVNLRSRRYNTLKDIKRYCNSINSLGCLINQEKIHIESQFYNNMTWRTNGKYHGKWQIHHTCPLEYIDWNDPVEQKYGFHYTNTQPLWFEDHCEIHRKINERMSQYENGGKPLNYT